MLHLLLHFSIVLFQIFPVTYIDSVSAETSFAEFDYLAKICLAFFCFFPTSYASFYFF